MFREPPLFKLPFLITLIIAAAIQAQVLPSFIVRNSSPAEYDHNSLQSKVSALQFEAAISTEQFQQILDFGNGAAHYAGMLLDELDSPNAYTFFDASTKSDGEPWSLLSLREILWQYYTQKRWTNILNALPRQSRMLEYRDFHFLRMSALYRLERYSALRGEYDAPSLKELPWNRVTKEKLEKEWLIWHFVDQYTREEPWGNILAQMVFDMDDSLIRSRLYLYLQNQGFPQSPAYAMVANTLQALYFTDRREYDEAAIIFESLIPRYSGYTVLSEPVLKALRTIVRNKSDSNIRKILAQRAHEYPEEIETWVTVAKMFVIEEDFSRAEYYYTHALERLSLFLTKDDPSAPSASPSKNHQERFAEISAESFTNSVRTHPENMVSLLEQHASLWKHHGDYFNSALEAILAQLLQNKQWITLGALYRSLQPLLFTRASSHIALAHALSPFTTELEKNAILETLRTQNVSPLAAAIASIGSSNHSPLFSIPVLPGNHLPPSDVQYKILYDYAQLSLRKTLQLIMSDPSTENTILSLIPILQKTGLAYQTFQIMPRVRHDLYREKLTNYYPVLHEEYIDYENKWFILSMIREESRFNSAIRSSAGAVGLMQLIPATAEEMSRKYDISFNRLDSPQKNIELGLAYVRELDGRFESPSKITAAYNAGPNRVIRWNTSLPNNPVLFALAIPFQETRNHIRKVFESFMWYTSLYQPSNIVEAPGYFFGIETLTREMRN